jgi:CubicO group peptidase (beta-lactamase class C family)
LVGKGTGTDGSPVIIRDMSSPNRPARHAFCLLLLIPAAASAQTPASASPDALKKIEQAIEAARLKHRVPGASVAIVHNDKIVFSKGFGYRDAARRLPATSNTVYCIGSSTKAFTGLLAAVAEQEGKLALSDSPSKHLPKFRINDEAINGKITLGDLLSHRSGLPRTDTTWYSNKFNRDELVEILGWAEPTAKLGQRFQYQNLMFLVASMAVEKVYQQPYDRLLQDRIFGPLGMTSTSSTFEGALPVKELSVGYAPDQPLKSPRPLPRKNIDVVAPAGSINSNVLDMAQWLRLQLNKGTVDGRQVVPEAAILETRKPRIDVVPGADFRYGLGWMLRKWKGHDMVGHGGNIDGFNAEVAMLPGQNLGVVVLTNVSASPLAAEAYNIVFENLAPVTEDPAATPAAGAKGTEVEDAALGAYRFEAANLDLTFVREGKRVIVDQGGMRTPMELVGERRYEVKAAGAVFTFRPSSKDPKQTEVLLEQGGQKITLVRKAPYQAPISVEQLHEKMLAARGGKEAILRYPNWVMKYVATSPSEGITAYGFRFQRGGVASSEYEAYRAIGRRFGASLDYVDGKSGWGGISFATGDAKEGKELQDALLMSNVDAEINWKKWFKSVKIVREQKVNGTDTYVVEKEPLKGGSKITEFVAKDTFHVVRRDTGSGPGAQQREFSDFRPVDGLVFPFKVTLVPRDGGRITQEVRSISFTERVPNWAFKPIPVERL